MSNWVAPIPSPFAYWVGKVLFELHHKPDDLALYKRDPQLFLEKFPLTAEMKAVILNNDVAGLYRSGVNPYLLRAHCIGMRIPEAVSLAALRSCVTEAANG